MTTVLNEIISLLVGGITGIATDKKRNNLIKNSSHYSFFLSSAL